MNKQKIVIPITKEVEFAGQLPDQFPKVWRSFVYWCF